MAVSRWPSRRGPWTVGLGLAGALAACSAPAKPTRRVVSATAAAPAAVPAAWQPIVGEYQRDDHRLSVLERGESLRVRVDSGPVTTVTLASPDSLLPTAASGARFGVEREADGTVTGLADGDGRWDRRPLGRGTFHITPVRPAAELHDAARAATPPPASPDAAPADLVDVTTLDSTIRLDIRYATTDNFMGERFYDTSRALLQRPAAEALARVSRRLAALGYGLLIHDAYRPWYVTWMFWQATPDSQRIFVADPASGSRHNRGAAVDLSLYELATGAPVTMPSGYDEFSERAYPAYAGGTSHERWQRDLLRAAMEAEGFHVYQYEWWHFDFDGWERYPVLNLGFDEVSR